MESHAGPRDVFALNLGGIGEVYSLARFHLGRIQSQLGNHEQAKERFATFLETFTQPDPEDVWMVTDARGTLEELARGRTAAEPGGVVLRALPRLLTVEPNALPRPPYPSVPKATRPAVSREPRHPVVKPNRRPVK